MTDFSTDEAGLFRIDGNPCNLTTVALDLYTERSAADLAVSRAGLAALGNIHQQLKLLPAEGELYDDGFFHVPIIPHPTDRVA